jgi:hypothetical protein
MMRLRHLLSLLRATIPCVLEARVIGSSPLYSQSILTNFHLLVRQANSQLIQSILTSYYGEVQLRTEFTELKKR